MTTRRASDSRDTREQEALHRADPATVSEGGPEGSAIATGTTGSWDPYEVWLSRIKQPRDETMRMRRLGEEREGTHGGNALDADRAPDAPPKPSPA